MLQYHLPDVAHHLPRQWHTIMDRMRPRRSPEPMGTQVWAIILITSATLTFRFQKADA